MKSRLEFEYERDLEHGADELPRGRLYERELAVEPDHRNVVGRRALVGCGVHSQHAQQPSNGHNAAGFLGWCRRGGRQKRDVPRCFFVVEKHRSVACWARIQAEGLGRAEQLVGL